MEKYHVTKHSDGSWQVLLGTGSKKAIKKFKTQKEALAYAEELAEKRNSTVYLHGKNGRVRDTSSYKEEDNNTVKRGRPRKVKEENEVEPVKEEEVLEKKEVKPAPKKAPVKQDSKKVEKKEEKKEEVEPIKEEVKEEIIKEKIKLEEESPIAFEEKQEDVTPKKKGHTLLIIGTVIIVLAIIGVLAFVFMSK